MKTSKVFYKPVGMTLGAVSGLLATAVFGQVWKRLGHDDDAPGPTDRDRDWPEVLLAAAIQGAVFSTVKAAVDRAGATAVHRLTGTWPG
ncbi:DUF4235 domain-containing protein [Streptomyces sp. NPDC014894]|uniref:DUF4235 domain-containing protein n=1 Tax=unclassified Streptomyces TaxID=2593676 RepID=UPI0036FA3528